MPSLSRSQAHRIRRMSTRLEALAGVLGTAGGPARRQRLLAGEARRALAEATAIFGLLPRPALESAAPPAVVLASILTIMNEAKPLLRQALGVIDAPETRRSFPRRFEDA